MNGYALGRKDSNLRIAGPKPVALPLGYAPFLFLFKTTKRVILLLVVRQFNFSPNEI